MTRRQQQASTSSNPCKDSSGQALVEFALSISIFVLLFIGFFGMAVVLFSFLTANEAAREGTRYLIAKPQATNTEVSQYICQTSVGLGGSQSNCNSMLGAGSLTITVEPDVDHRVAYGQIAVTVSYRVPVPTLSVGFLDRTSLTFLGPIWVSGVSVMRLE